MYKLQQIALSPTFIACQSYLLYYGTAYMHAFVEPHVQVYACMAKVPGWLYHTHHVGSKINAQYSDGREGEGNAKNDKQKEGGQFWNVGGQCVGNGLFQVVKDQTS